MLRICRHGCSIDAVRRAKADGLPITADTAPPYFLLNEIAVSTYDTAFKLSPPLRSEDDRQAVIEALSDGTIDAIASDHVPGLMVMQKLSHSALPSRVHPVWIRCWPRP